MTWITIGRTKTRNNKLIVTEGWFYAINVKNNIWKTYVYDPRLPLIETEIYSNPVAAVKGHARYVRDNGGQSWRDKFESWFVPKIESIVDHPAFEVVVASIIVLGVLSVGILIGRWIYLYFMGS